MKKNYKGNKVAVNFNRGTNLSRNHKTTSY